MWILAINPGGGSTKVAVFSGTRQFLSENVEHPANELVRFGHVLDQYALRKSAVLSVLDKCRFDRHKLQAIATRGGPLMPLPGGVYRITARVVADIRHGLYQSLHPALLGPLMAHELAEELSIPAYFVDPESTDEFRDVARVSGLKGIERLALSHALSCRAVAEAAAARLNKTYGRCRFVVAHMGTGITVAVHVNGRQVDSNNANDDGPFSPQRAGSLPLTSVVRLCFSGRFTERDVLSLVQRKGGLLSYLGTDDIRRVEAAAKAGNKQADLVFRAMAYQIGKEIGAGVAACGDRPDAIVLTGGLALSRRFLAELRKWVGHLGPKILVYPGEEEMSALVSRLLAVLSGKEQERSYASEIAVRR
jgi:butyrate kinase